MKTSTANLLLEIGEKLVTLGVLAFVLVYFGVISEPLQLDMMVNNGSMGAPAILILLVLGIMAHKSLKSIHRRFIPWILYIVCSVILVFAMFLTPSRDVSVVFASLLLADSVWVSIILRKFGKSKITTIKV